MKGAGSANLSGTSTTTIFNGGYSPGDSPAEVLISGDVSFGSTNTLFLELAGTTLDTSSLLSNVAISVVAGSLGDFDLDGDVDGADFLL